MVVGNADIVFNYELAKMYAVILCDSEVIPSVSLRHLVKHPHGQVPFGFSGCADGSLALQFSLHAPVSCFTYKIEMHQIPMKTNSLLHSGLQ